ncbi:MAG TPA: peptidylprolyl isomerase [Gammaproteobacteria bacterium]|jgi:FKBP-type peptidyl-prolyl cis-trans isomerase SlyD|nr:peptidylprolyl isomerase [Gammaproteobacteria bacterium]
MSERIAPRKLVSLTYRISDTEGVLLEQNDVPVSYLHGGYSEMFEKVERALEGKGAGDVVEVSLDPTEGFGAHDPNLTFTDDIENVPPEFRHLGAEVEMQGEHGEARTFIVTRIENGQLTVDCNHPFAGKTVLFRIEILSVRDASPDELREAGLPPGMH